MHLTQEVSWKNIALAYHYVRKHVAGNAVRVLKIKIQDNYSDPLTKGMSGPSHGYFMHKIMKK